MNLVVMRASFCVRIDVSGGPGWREAVPGNRDRVWASGDEAGSHGLREGAPEPRQRSDVNIGVRVAHVGDIVMVMLPTWRSWREGTMKQVHPDGRTDVKFDGGDIVRNIEPSCLRRGDARVSCLYREGDGVLVRVWIRLSRNAVHPGPCRLHTSRMLKGARNCMRNTFIIPATQFH